MDLLIYGCLITVIIILLLLEIDTISSLIIFILNCSLLIICDKVFNNSADDVNAVGVGVDNAAGNTAGNTADGVNAVGVGVVDNAVSVGATGGNEKSNDESVIDSKSVENGKSLIKDVDPIHRLNPDVKLTGEIVDLLANKKSPSLSHITDDAVNDKATQFSRLLNLSNTLPYKRRFNEFKRQLHWGQLKLFLTEVEFLTLILNNYKKSNNKSDIYFVYAGAAPGHHIYYLQTLFPTIHFELYDPNEFVVRDNEMLKTHVQFFTDDDAKYWSNRKDIYLTFCTDIRTEPATNENVARNMVMQMEWWKIMNPELSMFKFRLPWTNEKTKDPEGDIYIQPYPGPTSSETRLIVKANAKIIDYDNKQYEDACFYHNVIGRNKYYNTKLGKLSIEKDGIDNCYDCASLIYILSQYLKLGTNDISLKKLIAQVQNKITFGAHTIKSQTIRYFNETIEHLKRSQYILCNNKKCNTCLSGLNKLSAINKGYSKATIANEESFIKKKKDKIVRAL